MGVTKEKRFSVLVFLFEIGSNVALEKERYKEGNDSNFDGK
jgi:hypothetical protein